MNLIKMFKKNPIEYKQPQELYCSNFECLNEIAKNTELFSLLDAYGIKYASTYCIYCITERENNE